jgi:cell division protein FtsI (penicillin-binding protein 3)
MIGYEARQEAALSFRWRSYVLLGDIGCERARARLARREPALRDHGFLASQGNARFSRVAAIVAHRGTIIDRYGEPLAVSTPVDSVWTNPRELALATDQIPRLAMRR